MSGFDVDETEGVVVPDLDAEPVGHPGADIQASWP
jgi:hypothetical protein